MIKMSRRFVSGLIRAESWRPACRQQLRRRGRKSTRPTGRGAIGGVAPCSFPAQRDRSGTNADGRREEEGEFQLAADLHEFVDLDSEGALIDDPKVDLGDVPSAS